MRDGGARDGANIGGADRDGSARDGERVLDSRRAGRQKQCGKRGEGSGNDGVCASPLIGRREELLLPAAQSATEPSAEGAGGSGEARLERRQAQIVAAEGSRGGGGGGSDGSV